MRAPTALVLPAAPALALTVPAPPAQALPGCGGNYRFVAQCQFDAPLAWLVVVMGTAATGGRAVIAEVAVGAYSAVATVASCGRAGILATACQASGFVPASSRFTCRVAGIERGTYSCVAVPYLW